MSHSGELTSVEQHLAEILATITPLTPTELGLNDIGGLVLAEDVAAVSALPSFDNSGMDGYAVRVEDVTAATEEKPVTLPVTAEVAAGDTGAYALQPGTAIKIMTGAMLPHGAEAVVPVEWTDGGSARVSIRASAEYGSAIRLAGEDAKAGEVLVTAGTRLLPMHVAVIAAAGRGSVLVRPRPRVVVLSTGNELAEPGTPLVPGRIWDSNSFMLAAAAREAGCLAYRQAILPDHPDEVLPAIEDQLVRADLMVTTGGVSMGGEHDVIKAALQQLGTITFRKVAMQPGMPQGFGTIALPAAVAPTEPQRRRFRRDGYEEAATPAPAAGDRVPIFTLPGNPVSAYVSFQVFARPAIGALQGYHEPGLEQVRAELTGPLRSPAVVVLPARRARPGGREGNPADRAGFAPDSHAGQGQRAGRGAGVGRQDERGRHRRGAGPAVTSENAASGLTHVDSACDARMVDVSGKDVSARSACATGRVRLSARAVAALRAREVPKGDALAVARVAAIMGAKRTPDLVPLCHPIALHGVSVSLTLTDEAVLIEVTTRTADRTGVEMEALTAVATAALALIDMVKAVDPAASIERVRVLRKEGGKTGEWVRP